MEIFWRICLYDWTYENLIGSYIKNEIVLSQGDWRRRHMLDDMQEMNSLVKQMHEKELQLI